MENQMTRYIPESPQLKKDAHQPLSEERRRGRIPAHRPPTSNGEHGDYQTIESHPGGTEKCPLDEWRACAIA